MNETAVSRRRARVAGLLAVCGLPFVATACSTNSANSLGHRACLDVARSIKLYHSGQGATSGAVREKDQTEALVLLRDALRPAALAAGSDTDWQALEITLSESARVPEANLVSALQAQCAATLAS